MTGDVLDPRAVAAGGTRYESTVGGTRDRRSRTSRHRQDHLHLQYYCAFRAGAADRRRFPADSLTQRLCQSEGIRALLTQLMLGTATGFEAVDVRDHAAVIAAFVTRGQTGRHIVSGRYLPWPELIALFDELTGRRVRRIP